MIQDMSLIIKLILLNLVPTADFFATVLANQFALHRGTPRLLEGLPLLAFQSRQTVLADHKVPLFIHNQFVLQRQILNNLANVGGLVFGGPLIILQNPHNVLTSLRQRRNLQLGQHRSRDVFHRRTQNILQATDLGL